MRKIATFMVLLAATAVSLSSQPAAFVRELAGTVEVKPIDGDWQEASLDMELQDGFSISTGFNSHAILEVGESTLTVKPLTRMKLEELLQTGGLQTTSLFLRVGRMKATVKTTEGVKHDFTVKGPTATASVRGTEFEFDGSTLIVDSGIVSLGNSFGHSVSVAARERSEIRGYDKPRPAKEAKEAQGKVTPAMSGPKKDDKQKADKDTGKGGGVGRKDPDAVFGEIEIRWK